MNFAISYGDHAESLTNYCETVREDDDISPYCNYVDTSVTSLPITTSNRVS